jgi:hypothetical protein
VGNVSAVHRGSACYSACCPLSSRNADRAAQFHVRAGHPSLGMPPRKCPVPSNVTIKDRGDSGQVQQVLGPGKRKWNLVRSRLGDEFRGNCISS